MSLSAPATCLGIDAGRVAKSGRGRLSRNRWRSVSWSPSTLVPRPGTDALPELVDTGFLDHVSEEWRQPAWGLSEVVEERSLEDRLRRWAPHPGGGARAL